LIDCGDIGGSGPDRACSVDSARGWGKIGTVRSPYFSEIRKVLLEQGRFGRRAGREGLMKIRKRLPIPTSPHKQRVSFQLCF
jgi:hypothetical protein